MIDIIPPKINQKRPDKKIVKILRYFFFALAVAVAIYFAFKLINIKINSWLELEPISLNKIDGTTVKTTRDSQPVNNHAKADNKDRSKDTTKTLLQTLPETSLIKDQTAEASASAPAVDKTTITIKVLNGNGIPGAARKVKNILEQNSFKISATGNARSRYNSTVIYYQSAKKAEAELAKTTLENNKYQVTTEENSTLTGQNDLLIVVGKF